MRDLSPDVRALIWQHFREGDVDENDILRRILKEFKHGERETDKIDPDEAPALIEKRAGVSFPRGFEIFRDFQGKIVRARATPQGWVLAGDTQPFSSLNKLSTNLTGGSENAWLAWSYVDKAGTARKLHNLRNKGDEIASSSVESWRDTVRAALADLGGTAHLREIYKKAKELRESKGLSVPEHFQAIIRKELEINSPDSKNYQGRAPLFHSPKGIGSGIWSIDQRSSSAYA